MPISSRLSCSRPAKTLILGVSHGLGLLGLHLGDVETTLAGVVGDLLDVREESREGALWDHHPDASRKEHLAAVVADRADAVERPAHIGDMEYVRDLLAVLLRQADVGLPVVLDGVAAREGDVL